MYDRLTDRANKVLQLASQEAHRFHQEYVGTAHVLLGLLKEGRGVAANALKNLDVDLKEMRLEIERRLEIGPNVVTMGRLPRTPKARKVIEYAMEEARALNHNYVGSEHLLLGLLREEEDVAAQVLAKFGLTLEAAREETLNLLRRGIESSAQPVLQETATTSGYLASQLAPRRLKSVAAQLSLELFLSVLIAASVAWVARSWITFTVCLTLLVTREFVRIVWLSTRSSRRTPRQTLLKCEQCEKAR